MLLGTIHHILNKYESVDIKEGDEYITIQGKRLEVKIEGNQLRLSQVEVVSDKDEQYHNGVLSWMHLLESRRKDLAINKQELVDITNKLNNEELEADVEEDLERQARDKRAIKKMHMKEIRKLEAQTSISVNYRIVKTGYTVVIPPGLISQPKFMSEPICWCPWNTPESKPVEVTTTMVEELPINMTSAQHTTASGDGLKYCWPNQESKFEITAKDKLGEPRNVGGDKFIVESKETEIKCSVLDKKNGTYEVTYSAEDVKEGDQFFLAVTHAGCQISESPFSVSRPRLLVEFSSTDNHTEDWLDAAVVKMSSVPRARLWVNLHDSHGSQVYKSSGVTSSKWSQKHITAPEKQHFDDKHTNAIVLDNGDRLMIVGKGYKQWWDYLSYNIIINAGWDTSKISSYQHPRRMLIALKAPGVAGWNAPDNQISFASDGFSSADKKLSWPKFNGTFRIYYKPL